MSVPPVLSLTLSNYDRSVSSKVNEEGQNDWGLNMFKVLWVKYVRLGVWDSLAQTQTRSFSGGKGIQPGNLSLTPSLHTWVSSGVCDLGPSQSLPFPLSQGLTSPGTAYLRGSGLTGNRNYQAKEEGKGASTGRREGWRRFCEGRHTSTCLPAPPSNVRRDKRVIISTLRSTIHL